jgi:hypothetical protein
VLGINAERWLIVGLKAVHEAGKPSLSGGRQLAGPAFEGHRTALEVVKRELVEIVSF